MNQYAYGELEVAVRDVKDMLETGAFFQDAEHLYGFFRQAKVRCLRLRRSVSNITAKTKMMQERNAVKAGLPPRKKAAQA